MLIRNALRRSAAAAGPITPLATELNPDVGLDQQALSWTASHLTGTGSGYQANADGFTTQLTLGGSNAVVNTTGNTFSPGTYRMIVTIANWVASGATHTARIGVTEYIQNFPPITGNGNFQADMVVAAQSVSKVFRLSGASLDNFEVTAISFQRIA